MGRELLAVPLGVSIVGFGVAALVVHGLMALMTSLSTLKRYTAKQLLISLVGVASGGVSACGRGVLRTALSLMRWWLFFGVVIACFSFLHVTYSEYPEVWTGTARFYNGNIGPYVHQVVVIPLQITDILLRGLLPIWNSAWWFSKAIGIQGFLPIVINQIELLYRMATTLINLVRHLVGSLSVFVSSFFCDGAACLYPERGVLDVLSSLADAREFFALGIQLFRAFCGLLAAPADLVLYPLLDLNLAEGAHNLVNSAVQLLIVIPWTTAGRCALKAGDEYDLLMCTPDFAPFFNFLVAGVSSVGLALDNWVNIAFLIVQEALTGASPKCDPLSSGMIPDLVASSAVFVRAPVVVGLTDWLYAVTDGVTAMYMGASDGGRTKVQAWPLPGMNVGFGVAAVTYSSVHDLDVSALSSGKTAGSMQTTGMLACNCTDTADLGMVILCSILPMSGIPSTASAEEYLLQAMFPDTLVARQYACAGVDIFVKSVRWSFTRYQTTDARMGTGGGASTLPTNDCIARGTCREIDATVWVVPRCGQDQNLNHGGCTLTSACFPFCMASRSAGSGRDNLMLAGARRWREGLTILGQDCSMAGSEPGTVQAGMGRTGAVSRTEGNSAGLLQSGTTGVYAFSSVAQECKRAARVTSVIDKPPGRVAANVRLYGQPYVITGDTAFTEVELGGGASSVQVERLEGSEADVFSLNPINQQLPAHPRTLVPLGEAEHTDTSKVLIPYSYSTTRIAAVSTRNYVFYASNPALDAFGAYFQYCADRQNLDKLSKMGLLLMSSYSPIRIYRVSAYRRCAAYSCGPDLVRFETIQGFSQKFERGCGEVFNASVLALEYLNEDNIAVTVQTSGVWEYSEASGAFSGPNTTSKTYWLNPTTMGLQETIWQTAVPTSSYAVLCPSMQRLPRVGSFAAELVNSVVFAARYVVFACVYTPGMVPVWRGGGRCPSPGGTQYHSVLGNCGAGLYSLDDFFDSLDDAAAIFWHSLSLTGQLLAGDDQQQGSAIAPLTQVLDGMSQYGQGTIDLWAARAGVLTLTRVPIKEQLAQLWVTVEVAAQGGALQGLAYGGAGIAAWSRYIYKVLSTLSLDLIKRTLDPKEQLTVKRVFALIWAGLYDLQDEFSATITSRNRLGCGGLKLIFGLDNPWSDLIYHQCASGAELTEDLIALALTVFVEIPMAKCVCKDSAGQDLSTFVVSVCAPALPVSLLPTLYMIANEARGAAQFSSLACERVVARVKADVGGALDPWFDHQYKGLDALGSSVDYMTAVYDAKAGRCLDFQNDPHVVVIVPQPVDYFQRCSGTSACKRVCSAEWAQFQSVVQAPVLPLPSISVATESMFFPGTPDPSLVLRNVEASVELPSSSGVCLARPNTSPPDYVLAVAEVTWPAVTVEYWCAPRMASGSVYRNETIGYGFQQVPGTLLSLQFGDDTGGWLAMLVQVDKVQAVLLLNRTGLYETPAVDTILPTGVVLMRIENLWVIHGALVVDLVTRRMTSSRAPETGQTIANSVAIAFHAFLAPGGNATLLQGIWLPTSVDLIQFGGYQYTRLSGGAYLFLPTIGGLPLHRLEFILSMRYLEQTAMVTLSPTDLSSLSGAALASNSQGGDYVFATKATGWDWLKQVRVGSGGYVTGVFGSASIEVEVEIQGRCDARGCEGCGTVQLQRLCMAYNKCALVNCVGTPVHQRRPLCGIGGLLRHSGKMALRSTQGAWSIFSEMLGLTMELSLLSLREAHLLWPEDEFLCYICEAKDKSAEFFSILTATVNSALQLGEANIGYMYGGASNVDTNADAVLTISSTALNGFMHQLALMPLYEMVAYHQIMMCQVSGVLALMDGSGFKLSLKPADGASASDTIAGQCLTVGAEVLANYPGDSRTSLGYTVTSIASNALQLLLIQQIEPFLHVLDAFLAYIIGVVHTLGVLIMSQSMSKCNPPDFYIKDVVKCACGDDRLQIASRAQKVADHALWCSGVLSMIDSSNQPYYVYNPYSYAELQAMAGGLDAYVQCVADAGTNGYKCPVPTSDFFTKQGVTTINVLVKCRENFVKRRWDPAAYVLYQRGLHHLLKVGARIEFPPDNYVQACLREGDGASGSLAQTCLQRYLGVSQVSADEYWAYERVDAGKDGAQYTDACLVFTGPAARNLTVFADCVDGLSDSELCTLPGHIWTPLSANDVPVAEQHRVLSHGVNRDGLVQRLYAKAQAKVLTAVASSIAFQQQGGDSPVSVEFFSVEGDILHQTMDCIFMGPYSRVDYWPIPTCQAEQECLVGPYWSRDEGGGLARGVDAKTCPAEPTLPYTCGSPARKAAMRYLVKDLLPSQGGVGNKNTSLIHEILVRTLEGIRADWANTSAYACPYCEDGLPSRLNRTFTSIESTTVLQALEDNLGELYDLALEDRLVWREHLDAVEPDEAARYNWTGSRRAQDEARFNPTKPVSTYTSAEEALSPLLQDDGTLWDVCHGSLKQVFFTLRMETDGRVKHDLPDPFDGNASRLQEYVRGFTLEAWKHSPLFRHYSPRHAPSWSQMCAQVANQSAEEGFATYSDLRQDGTTLLDGQSLPTNTRVYSAQRFRVGELGCLCGWRRVGERCIVPETTATRMSVCARVPCVDHSYHVRDEPALLAAFRTDWHCPEFELSAHWGFMDAEAAERWLGGNATTLATSSRELFQHGRAGLRPGNVRTLPVLAKTYLNPTTREIPAANGRLTTCGKGNTTADLAQEFLDELFPAAQGVDEAGAVAYCLRYVIELARLEILALLDPTLEDQLVLQREQVAIWRRRCEAQLHLLHLCVHLGVFRPRVLNSRTTPKCAHFRPVETGSIYTTPQCLISVDGVFYDPCRCVPCVGDASQVLNVTAVLTGACRLRFDPRTMLEPGVPIGWTDGVPPQTDRLLRADFAGEILDDPDATGNTGGPFFWWDAEGPMADNSAFCDTVVDWWDEAWDFPVGYHVTVPCDANETAYRSFVQAFALDEAGHALVYQHDLLRDVNLADSHFGVGGLCRSTNLGMPMYETNNVRYCTSIPDGGGEDFALPVEGGADPAGHGWTPMRCAASSQELPWPSSDLQANPLYQSAHFSVGTVPNMPPESSPTYPASEESMWDLGPWQETQTAGDRWGSGDRLCQDFDLFLCANSSVCPDGYECRGRVCGLDPTKSCTNNTGCAGLGECGGVCMDASTVECIMHSDCDATLMCSGVGTCVQPVITVENRLADENISFSLAAQGGCGSSGRAFSLLGGSYWGNTGQDLLRVHGMCSFEDWFKYSQFYSQPGCATASGGALDVDPTRCPITDLQKQTQNETKWWPAGNARPELMYLRPTNCDRDYERLEGFTQCAPAVGWARLVYPEGEREANEYDRFVRLHASGASIRLARMPELNDTAFGFIGLGGKVADIQDLTGDAHPFLPCATVGQCFTGDFTVNGAIANRTLAGTAGRVSYPDNTVFKCGVFGIDTGAGCKLDLDVVPLYRYLCWAGDLLPQCRALMPTTINRLCANIQYEYQASNLERTAVLEGLVELFYGFPGFQTVDQYLALSGCMGEMHARILARAQANPGKVSRGLYYPLMFALYEFPFDWFYQCIVMAGGRVNPDTRRQQDCRAYRDRAKHSIEAYQPISPSGDAFDIYLQYVRGGYTQTDYDGYADARADSVRVAVQAARGAVQAALYPGGLDRSYPTCSQNMLWQIGEYGDRLPDYPYDKELRALVWNWYDLQSCRTNWQSRMIQELTASTGITNQNWQDRLTYPDPLNVVPQSYPARTLLQHIEEYMRDSTGVVPLASIVGGGALWYNTTLPLAYDEAVSPLSEGLAPQRSADTGTTTIDDTVNQTCAFRPEDDPAFAGIRTTACTNQAGNLSGYAMRRDTLRTCSGVRCSSVPVLYRSNGRFRCGYKADGGIIPAGCTEDSPGCYRGVLDAMYGEIRRRYQPPPGEPLRARLLPWFNSTSSWDFPSFNLSAPLDYQANIQPNPERAVMCQITTDKSRAVDFTKCNNPHYLALKQHAQDNYKQDAGVIVPFGSRLEWPVDRGVLERGVILSYTNRNRSLRQTFMDALFDDETVCKQPVQQRVCWKQGVGDFVPENPWMLGNFNPYEVCDVDFTSQSEGGAEYIYSFCKEGNGACSKWADPRQAIPARCNPLNTKLISVPGVPRLVSNQYLDYNLCYHRLEEDSDGCMHDQGLLGGFDGLPVSAPADSRTMLDGTKYADSETYTVGVNLYEPSRWSIPSDFRAGPFAGTNPLWQGDDAPYGHLQVTPTDIGGHRLEMGLSRGATDSISALTMEGLPLGVVGASQPVSQWVGGLMDAMQAEHDAVVDLYPVTYGQQGLGASCPLQRWLFYSGGYRPFSPAIPATQRARHLFHRIHEGLLSHPTMKRAALDRQYLGRYRSANGFCACPVLADIAQPQCLIPTSDGAHRCSMARTVQALQGGVDTEAMVFAPLDHGLATKRCGMQLDWPNVDGVLRDGSTLDGVWGDASSTTQKECHVLDRFRPFRYRYESADSLRNPAGLNTIRDGVCQTRRVVSLASSTKPENTRCLRKTLTDTSASFSCNASAMASMPRRVRRTMRETLAQQRKQRCSQCSPPPRFTSEQGRAIPPESSFGRLHRWSAERMLAKDLRDAICPNNQSCHTKLNASAWRRGEFMRNYMLHPERLFALSARNNTEKNTPSAKEPIWEGKPWVYCPTPASLQTGEGCKGVITREDWTRSKATVCPRMIRSISTANLSAGGEDPMARTPFCNIDTTTNSVCRAIVDAKALVRQANCVMSGDSACMPSPFVYHPASYEPSNNAWVHDSVKAFYKRVDPNACPVSSQSDLAYLEFMRKHQRSCPANAVYLVKGILQTVRVVVTDAALLMTTMLSMFFKMFALLFSVGREQMQAYLVLDWLYLRAKGAAMVETASDLLVDALLNSGELGARIMGFLHRTCTSINAAISWYLNIWCNYIQRYMVQVLSGLRQSFGMIGAGFEMLNDFMDEVFQGILPASFLAKYGTKGFQGILAERYSQPTAHDDKVKAKANVPSSANMGPVSRGARVRNSLNSAGKTFGRVMRNPVMRVAGKLALVGAVLDVVNLVTGIIDTAAEQKMRELYPENFTLFDFSEVVNTLDDMEGFLQEDDTCYTFQLFQQANRTYAMFPCLTLDLKRYNGTTAGTTAISATQCWADASPSLGQNSLFSCTAVSTCCKSATDCSEFIPCGTCAVPALDMTNRYGCDGLRQMCVCGMVQTGLSKCSANRQCGTTSQCELITSMGSASYGTIPCAQCPATSRVMCLLHESGMPGRCACMMISSGEYDLCSEVSGVRTTVDSSKLCGFLPGQTLASTRWAFDMEDLVMAACAQVSIGICSTVYQQQGRTFRMVVAASVRVAARGGRRLLSVVDEGPARHTLENEEYDAVLDDAVLHELLLLDGWNRTAAPCSALAGAYQTGRVLGVLETYEAHRCGFWRHVGRRLVQRHNLTGVPDTFLLSLDDFLRALMSPEVAVALVRRPGVLVEAALYHPWMRPVRAFGVLLSNQLERFRWMREVERDVQEAAFAQPLREMTEDWPRFVPRFAVIDITNETQTPVNASETVQILENASKNEQILENASKNEATHTRRLLSVQDNVQAVLAYSAQVIKGAQAQGQVPTRVAGSWSTASFVWPPVYDYYSLETCPIGKAVLHLGREVVVVNRLYFENFGKDRPGIDRSLRGTLPSWPSEFVRSIPDLPEKAGRSWPSSVFHWGLAAIGVRPAHLVAFFKSEQRWSLQWILQTAVQCDLASVLTCARHDRDLLMSTVVFALLFLAVRVVTSALGVGFLSIVFLFSYPLFILWYTFGMAPTCLPMVPTCLLEDIIATVGALVPEAVVFPNDLLRPCGVNQTCLRSCSELNFTTWADPLAFAVCDTDPGTCAWLSGFVGWDWMDPLWAPLRTSMHFFGGVVGSGQGLAGHRLCTWVTFVTATPVLALLVSAVVVFSAVCVAVLDLIPPVVALFCQLYAFHST